jgi:ribonucleoside-diphosphate reductase alpha chain
MIESTEVDFFEEVDDLPPYTPSERAWEVLVEGEILSETEAPQDMLNRVMNTLFSVEQGFNTPSNLIKRLKHEFATYLAEGYCMLGTPILTNAGRYETALSSCAIIPVDFRTSGKISVQEQICAYYRQNMGSGFNLTNSLHPIALLHSFNDLSAKEAATGNYERYIGNMGILHISHPAIQEFIRSKHQNNMRHFNISVDISEQFMNKVKEGGEFFLSDGTAVNAHDLFQQIAENAWYNGDPGLIFLDRMNQDNPLARMSVYVGTPPCAEMGLAEGETCHFGYLNLSRFVRGYCTSATIDYDMLWKVTHLLTRALDNAVEYSIPRYPTKISADVASMKRRIGIGVCGLADLLLAFDLPYHSQEARTLARDIISFISYASKWASVELAEQRGSCTAMNFASDNDYLNGQFLEKKYSYYPTHTVSAENWVEIAGAIREKGLRNISTTALPPTGRASLLLDTTSSIEPFLNLFDRKKHIRKAIRDYLIAKLQVDEPLIDNVCREAIRAESFQHIDTLPTSVRDCLKTAKEISPEAQVRMVAEVAGLHGVVDESASKTVNLPNWATVDDIQYIFLLAYELGVKNISVYRDKTMACQPV